MQNIELKKSLLKITRVIISMASLNLKILILIIFYWMKNSIKKMVQIISYKTLIGAKPLRISFVKVDGFIIVYDGIRYLVLFGLENYDAIYNKIRYLIGVKSGMTYIFS